MNTIEVARGDLHRSTATPRRRLLGL